MAKVSRSMLKGIVKECLVEILSEGLTGGDTASLNESINNTVKSNYSSAPQRSIKSQKPKKIPNERFEENSRRIISQTTSDPVMAELLADTAKTTLQEQNTADTPNRFAAKPTDTYSKIVDNADPMDLFGESSSNWAHLAFADK